MADKKDIKEKYLTLLDEAVDAAGSKSGNALSHDEVLALQDDLIKIPPEKVPQWLASNKDKLSRIPEVASNAEYISITENPKVTQKDYGFTEGEDFYKMEGPKSWMNKSTVQLEANAKKYGMELGEYLNLVAKLSTEKEKDRQWKENATAHTFKDVPFVGDVNIPGLTSIILPTSFNKATMGKEVNPSDVAYDVALNELEAGMAVSPFGGKARYAVNPIVAALTGNAARQGKQLYDETQDEFSPLSLGGAGAMGAFGTPIFFKSIGDALKRVPGTQGIKPYTRMVKSIEDIGETSPQKVLDNKVNELIKDTQKYRNILKLEQQKLEDATAKLAQQIGLIDDYVPFNPTPVEARLYGKGSKLWRNVKNGEILTDKEYNDAIRFLTEVENGPNYIPPSPKPSQSKLYERAVRIKNMPMGDILVNAWSEPRIAQILRQAGESGSGVVGGRAGISISENDKKEMANRIINSTEWGKYITGLPHNLTDEEIYIATVYGDDK